MKKSYYLKSITGSIIFFLVIFIAAGKINYPPGIIYTGIGILMMILSFTVFRLDDELLQERAKPAENTQKWDKTILGLSSLAILAIYIIGGLDSGRFGWSHGFPDYSMIFGGILTAVGQLIFLIAQKQNSFFSSTVRIQNERGHNVCQSGLYRIVRHPAYAGSIIQTAGFPLLFRSVWVVIPCLLLIVLFIIRTQLEDKFLSSELNGYQVYSEKTRFKLLPFIW